MNGGMDKMKKNILTFLLFLLLALPIALAQSTTVSVTVVDANSQAWAGGTISYQFRPNPNYPTSQYSWNGSPLPSNYLIPTTVDLDGSGHASFSIPSNIFIVPAGSSWVFVVCPNASIACVTVFSAVSGSSLDISSTINAALPSNGIVMGATNVPKAYADSEVKTLVQQGGIYYNVLTQHIRFWNGTIWQDLGGGGGSGCSVVGIPTGAILHTNGTGCAGESYFTDDAAGDIIIDGGGSEGGADLLVRSGADIELDSNTDPTHNNWLLTGHHLTEVSNGAGNFLAGIQITASDSSYALSNPALIPMLEILTSGKTNAKQIGMEVTSNISTGTAGLYYNGYEYDAPVKTSGSSLSHVFGFIAGMEADGLAPLDAGFISTIPLGGTIDSGHCGYDSALIDFSVHFLQLDCGPNHTNFLGGTTYIAGPVGIAGGNALLGGTSPNSGAPPTGYVGFSGPTTVTNPYWIPIPGTFPGSTVSAIGCSGSASPLSCAWDAIPSTNRTCNSNGCYTQAPDGTLHQWGATSIPFSGSSLGSIAITYPIAFTTTTNLSVRTNATQNVNGTPDVFATWTNGGSTSGTTIVGRCGVDIAGGGCPSGFTGTVTVAWSADGN